MSFMKQHKFLSIIFVVCIFLMIKNSSIPYLIMPPPFIAFVFDKPQNDFLLGIAQMIDIFSSAYVTSLLFYYMVDFLPGVKQEKKAKEIISPKLVSLYLYISELLAMIKYSAKKENLLQTGNPDDMDKLHIKDEDVLCKKRSFKNEQENGTAAHSYNLLKDCDKFRTLILNICSEISCTPSFSYCDKQVIHIISEIQLSELLRMVPKPDDFFLKLDFVDMSYMGLGQGYQKLVLIQKELADFVETRLSCEMIDISNNEIEKWEKERVETFRQNPELVRLIQLIIAQQNK